MKTWVLRFKTEDRDNFLEIKRGLKTIETRAATPRYRKIQKGDLLIFMCGKERIKRRVKSVSIFKSIAGLTKKFNFKKIMPSLDSSKEMAAVYHGYPNYKNKLKKFGLIALELSKK